MEGPEAEGGEQREEKDTGGRRRRPAAQRREETTTLGCNAARTPSHPAGDRGGVSEGGWEAPGGRRLAG